MIGPVSGPICWGLPVGQTGHCGRSVIMTKHLKRKLAALSIEERLELIDGLWDGIEETQVAPRLTLEQEALLDARLEAHLRNPDAPRTTLKEIAAKLGVAL
jgi:putative addiction module component (TIGR02574 family)